MASYKQAITWMVMNDDTGWAEDDDEPCSVTAALVANLFDKSDDRVRADIRKALAKTGRSRPPGPLYPTD